MVLGEDVEREGIEPVLRPVFFFFNDTATTEIYALSLHDALPIWGRKGGQPPEFDVEIYKRCNVVERCINKLKGYRAVARDRKSTRLNSSHANISYAVFCLKKNILPSRPAHFSYHLYSRHHPLRSS